MGVIDDFAFDGNDTAIGTNGHLDDGYTLDVTNTTFVGPQGSWQDEKASSGATASGIRL